jgi:CrcB protein
VRRARFQLLAAVAAGGAVGTLARAGLDEAIGFDGTSWPWATFAANVVGAFLLGLFATRLQERLPPSTYRRPLLGTGFCGGLTTFSTFQVELVELADHGRVGLAAGYVCASLATGLAAAAIATAATRRVRRW